MFVNKKGLLSRQYKEGYRATRSISGHEYKENLKFLDKLDKVNGTNYLKTYFPKCNLKLCIAPGMSNAENKRYAGFFSESHMLIHALLFCNEDMSKLFESYSN